MREKRKGKIVLSGDEVIYTTVFQTHLERNLASPYNEAKKRTYLFNSTG